MTDILSISWSALRVHSECRQKAFLMRAGKRSPAKDIRNYYAGNVVDRVMQDWLADPHRQRGQMVEMVEHQMVKGIADARAVGDGVVRWRHADDRDDVREFCTDLIRRLEPILVEHVLPYPFQGAFRFCVPVTIPYLDGSPTTVNLTGEMDLLVRRPDGWVVWDLKGTRDDQYWRRTVAQLVFYDIAVLGLHGARTVLTGLIQPMCPEPILGFVVTDEMRRQLWARIHRMASEIWAKDFACKDSTSGCSWCEVRHACPRFDPDNLAQAIRHVAQESQ